MMGAPTIPGLFYMLLHRITSSTCVALVFMLDLLTVDCITSMQGLYLGCLVFLIAEATESVTIRLRLFKRVCLLYCNQKIRGLFDARSTELAALTNLFLAVCVAILMMVSASQNSDDIQSLLSTLTYLYGDVLNFTLASYGAFKITVAALMVGVWTEGCARPTNRVYAFCFDLIKIISANLLCQGVDMLIQSDAVELEVLECMVTVAVTRMFMPSIESYLTFIASRRIVLLIPGGSCFFGCVLVLILNASFISNTGKVWLGELVFNYIVIDTSRLLMVATIQWAVFMVVILHYTDYIVTFQMKALGVT